MRIFVSSPTDLVVERKIAVQVIGRLRAEFQHHFAVKALLWEHEPLLATEHFQEGLVSPAECDIVVCMFWSTLGSPLPAKYLRDDGTPGITGTEWEFHIARKSFLKSRKPDILVYRKTQPISIPVRDHAAVAAAQHDLALVDQFFQATFHNADADNTFSGAYWPFADALEFEKQLYTHLAELLRRAVSRGLSGEASGAITWYGGSPYRGLKSFEFEHADIFFGRSAPRNEILQQFRQQLGDGSPFLMVTGGSGTGKSSLVKAGLLPLLTSPHVIRDVAECRWCVFKPSDSPLDVAAGLLSAAAAKGVLPEFAATPFPETPAVAAERIRNAVTEAGRSARYTRDLRVVLLVVVDQFEELFSHADISESVRKNFVALLSTLVASGHVWIIGTLRSDFLERCERYPELLKLMRGLGQFHLGMTSAEELDLIIRLPARAAGLTFEVNAEGIGLDSVLREAASGRAALPLLSFTLEELYVRKTANGVLTFAAYKDLGGLEGAITVRATEALACVSTASNLALPELLASLITIQEEGATAIARTAGWAYIAESDGRRQLAEAFVHARLLTVEDEPGRGRTVRLAHESLLSRWQKAADWIRDNQEFLRGRARVFASAAYWDNEERAPSLLLADGRLLDRAEEMLRVRRQDLSSLVVDYIEASLRQRSAQREERRAEQQRRRTGKLRAADRPGCRGGCSTWFSRRRDPAAGRFLRRQGGIHDFRPGPQRRRVAGRVLHPLGPRAPQPRVLRRLEERARPPRLRDHLLERHPRLGRPLRQGSHPDVLGTRAPRSRQQPVLHGARRGRQQARALGGAGEFHAGPAAAHLAQHRAHAELLGQRVMVS